MISLALKRNRIFCLRNEMVQREKYRKYVSLEVVHLLRAITVFTSLVSHVQIVQFTVILKSKNIYYRRFI